VSKINLLICKLDGEFYAYHNACPAESGHALDDALFEPPMLTCSCHGYLLRSAARALGREAGVATCVATLEGGG
jgi:hypothetical protein